MPELPEVEAARRAIEEHCIGKKIKKATVADDPKVIDGVSPSDFQASLLGKTIVAARRKGKNMWLQLDSPPFPTFQFGMTGAVYIKGVAVTKYKRSAVNDTDEWPSKYSKVFIELDDGLELSFTDKRRFARVRLLEDPESAPPISELGPDALLEPMPVDEFAESLGKKKIAIKPLLLDQSYISGIGNWMADEVLYQARIHPLQITANLSKEQCEALHKCMQEVIEKALEVGADSSQFPNNWIFHSREKRPGKAFVDGKKIEFITAGGRTSAFVPELQKLTGTPPGKSPTTKRGKRSNKVQKDEDAKEEGESEEEEDTKKKGSSSARAQAKGQSKSSHGESEEEENTKKKGGRAKKTATITKSKEARMTALSKKSVKSSQTSSQPKKKARK